MDDFRSPAPTPGSVDAPGFVGNTAAGGAVLLTKPLTDSVAIATDDLSTLPDSGLVISAITAQTDLLLGDLVSETFAFPTADMLGAAAAMWPCARDRAIVTGWHGLVGRGVATKTRHAIAGSAEHWENVEGPRARVDIAPGLVRVARTDQARAERTRERLLVADIEARQHQLEQLARPMALADLEPLSRGTRSTISAWSAKSRAGMIAAICELDLAPIVSGEMIPCMITLTLPGDWLAVTPDAVTAAKKFHNFERAWRHKWGSGLVCIWKREFQRRAEAPRTLAGLDSGRAPHWHIWTVPPVPMSRMREFKAWLSATWTRVLFGRGVDVHPDCVCSEPCRSLGAGTGVDLAEGLRARDPKRLAIYFLKESLGGEGKAYQNAAPPEWDGQSVGRFWGYRGIVKAVVSVEVDAGVDVAVLRVLRRWQHAQGITRQVRVQRIDTRTGVLRLRNVRRPARVVGSAGWVAVNSGADLAAQLGQWATIVSERLWADRELFVGRSGYVEPESVERPLWAAQGPLRLNGGFPVPAV